MQKWCQKDTVLKGFIFKLFERVSLLDSVACCNI